jgi:hypothetical protein
LLASKLQLIQCIWGFKYAALIALQMGYKPFIMDIRMYGNALSLNYKPFSVLVTDGTWFKNMWELLHDFNTTASFGTKNQINPAHIGD